MSIGVPTYNRPEQLDRLLHRLRRQTFDDIEIVVSDNCSPDSRVWDAIQYHARRDERIRSYRQEKNRGAFVNHRFVKDRARGKYFLWAHDDDEWPADYVAICLAHLESQPAAVLVGPSCDRHLDGKYWLTYENWSSLGQTTFERLERLIPDAFTYHWRFEQYTYGMFVKDAAPKRMSRDFKSQFHHFFILSEAGAIIHAPELRLIKHTTQENLASYGINSHYRRHFLLRPFGWRRVESVQQCVPITLQMLRTIILSNKLTWSEKRRLVAKIVRLFARYPVRDELTRVRANLPFRRR